MTELTGKPVSDRICEELKETVSALKAKGVIPTLAVIRVGEREDDLAYERGLKKKFEANECNVVIKELPEDVTQETLDNVAKALGEDDSIHGILMFRPLPRGLTDKNIVRSIKAGKDSDAMGMENMARLFAGDEEGFAPCTAQAVIELIKYYGIDLKGKKVTVVGRSLVIGKPVALMLIKENATVTVCHTKTKDLASECRNADIIVAAAGSAKMIGKDHVREGQIVIDVGMNVDEEGKLCGDVDLDSIKDIIEAGTPVPRGVGSVTTSVLLKHVVQNAARSV
ncbi:MAG: bifunctional 5,10-methylenetetrahydrofolate dehydrogenase/5,10-methenyltetrahydrofolate cyclohydrolase [Clostridiales bacterium]|nr:bifunctional 5,10-methylenetetrahydrofolate dehydrogenase/5,10-methenyltetrahydrofolate cyclohydrolase [Clostridiales bacterium]